MKFLFRFFTTLSLMVFGWSTIQAQWQYIGSPEIGTPIDTDEDGDTIYVCTKTGLFYSTDNTISWKEIKSPDLHLTAKRVEAANHSVYIVTSDITNSIIQVFRTNDFGESWIEINPDINLSFSNPVLLTLGDTLIIYTYNDIARSYDRGDTYVTSPLNDYEKLFFHQNKLFAIKVNSLYESQDHGLTWDSIYTEPASRNLFEINSIEGQLWKSVTGWAFENLEVSRSTDNGLSWVPIVSVSKDSLGFYSPYVIGRYGSVYIVDHTQSNELYFSGDNGLTWKRKITPAYVYDPFLTENSLVFSQYNGIYTSEDEGDSYHYATDGFKAASVHDFVLNGQDILVNANQSMFKQHVDEWPLVENIHGLVSTLDGHLFALVDNLPKRSSDGGATWITIPNSAFGSPFYLNWRAFIAAGNVFYAVASTDTWYSLDYGATWKEEIYTVNAVEYNQSFVATQLFSNEILFSSDGVSWQNITYNLAVLQFSDVFMLEYYNGYVFTSSDQGFFRLNIFEDTWERLNGPIPNDSANYFYPVITNLESYNGAIIVGVHGFGVYVSTDYGDSWQEENEGLEDFRGFSSEIIGNDFYLGAEGGVWKRPLHELIISNVSEPDNSFTISISPMPVKDILSIHLEEYPMQGEILLSLYDAHGVLVKSKTQGDSAQLFIQVSDLPQGVYFLQVKTNERRGTVKFVKS